MAGIVKIKLSDLETDPVSDMLTNSDHIKPYIDHYVARDSGGDTAKTLAVIATLPKGERYLTRIIQCLAWALSDYTSDTVRMDLPFISAEDLAQMEEELAIREWQLRDLRKVLNETKTEGAA